MNNFGSLQSVVNIDQRNYTAYNLVAYISAHYKNLQPLCNVDKTLSSSASLHFAIFQN